MSRIRRLHFDSFIQSFLEEELTGVDDCTFSSSLMDLHVNVESTTCVPTRVDGSKVHRTGITSDLDTTKVSGVVGLGSLILTGSFEVRVDTQGITMPDLNASSRYQLAIVGIDHRDLQIKRESIRGFSATRRKYEINCLHMGRVISRT